MVELEQLQHFQTLPFVEFDGDIDSEDLIADFRDQCLPTHQIHHVVWLFVAESGRIGAVELEVLVPENDPNDSLGEPLVLRRAIASETNLEIRVLLDAQRAFAAKEKR